MSNTITQIQTAYLERERKYLFDIVKSKFKAIIAYVTCDIEMCNSTFSCISTMISLSGDCFKKRNLRYQTATLADIYSKHMLNYINTFTYTNISS